MPFTCSLFKAISVERYVSRKSHVTAVAAVPKQDDCGSTVWASVISLCFKNIDANASRKEKKFTKYEMNIAHNRTAIQTTCTFTLILSDC